MPRWPNLGGIGARAPGTSGPREPSSRHAFALLFDHEAPRVYRFVLNRCGSQVVAEDVTSQVFVNAAKRFAEGHGDDVSPQWLTTVARRRLIDHWRRAKRERTKWMRSVCEQTRQQPAADDYRMERALGSLPVHQRAALTLRYMDGFSVAEVADALGLSYRAAESALARARASFRRAYEEGDDDIS